MPIISFELNHTDNRYSSINSVSFSTYLHIFSDKSVHITRETYSMSTENMQQPIGKIRLMIGTLKNVSCEKWSGTNLESRQCKSVSDCKKDN